MRALKELARILRVGGRILITVWAKEQRHRKVKITPLIPNIRKDITLCVCLRASRVPSLNIDVNQSESGDPGRIFLARKRMRISNCILFFSTSF